MLAETKVNRSIVDRTVEQIEDQLRIATNVLKQREREILSGFEVTPPQFEALLVLRESGELTMGELCNKMYMACSTATDLVDRMERNGTIERVRDRNDRRVIRLRVMPKGHSELDAVLSARRTFLADVMSSVDLSDKERLIQALDQLQYVLSKRPTE